MAHDAKTTIDLGIERIDYSGRTTRAVLELTTRSGGVESYAQVGWNGDSFRSVALGMGGPGGDYRRRCGAISGVATQKRIDTLHATTFTPELIAEITEQATAYSQGIVDREIAERARSSESAKPPYTAS